MHIQLFFLEGRQREIKRRDEILEALKPVKNLVTKLARFEISIRLGLITADNRPIN